MFLYTSCMPSQTTWHVLETTSRGQEWRTRPCLRSTQTSFFKSKRWYRLASRNLHGGHSHSQSPLYSFLIQTKWTLFGCVLTDKRLDGEVELAPGLLPIMNRFRWAEKMLIFNCSCQFHKMEDWCFGLWLNRRSSYTEWVWDYHAAFVLLMLRQSVYWCGAVCSLGRRGDGPGHGSELSSLAV